MLHVTEPAHDDTHEAPEDDELRPLEERLRRLNWPQPPPEVRERTLEELRRKVAEQSSNGDGAASNGDGRSADEPDPSDSIPEHPA